MMFWRKLGLNIFILNIYYLKGWVPYRKFVFSMLLVFIDRVVIFYAFQRLAAKFEKNKKKKKKEWIDPLDELADDGICLEKSEASNIYEDLSIKHLRVVPLFFVQMMLISFYVRNLNDDTVDSDDSTKDVHNVKWVNWVVAVVFSIYASDQQVGEKFSGEYWEQVLGITSPFEPDFDDSTSHQRNTETDDFADVGGVEATWFFAGRCCSRRLPSIRVWHGWLMRWAMDFAVNSVSRDIIVYTVPILVSVEGPLDFVKDLTAVMFISTLDDLETHKSVKQILVKLKFREFLNRWDWDREQRGPVRVSDEEAPHQWRHLLSFHNSTATSENVKQWMGQLNKQDRSSLLLSTSLGDYVDDNEEEFKSLDDSAAATLWQSFREARQKARQMPYVPPQ